MLEQVDEHEIVAEDIAGPDALVDEDGSQGPAKRRGCVEGQPSYRSGATCARPKAGRR